MKNLNFLDLETFRFYIKHDDRKSRYLLTVFCAPRTMLDSFTQFQYSSIFW